MALAESLAIAHRDQGVRVSVVCPQVVDTVLFASLRGARPSMASTDGMPDADTVADRVVEGTREERFLIRFHPETLTHYRRKAEDYDRWLAGMRRAKAAFRVRHGITVSEVGVEAPGGQGAMTQEKRYFKESQRRSLLAPRGLAALALPGGATGMDRRSECNGYSVSGPYRARRGVTVAGGVSRGGKGRKTGTPDRRR